MATLLAASVPRCVMVPAVTLLRFNQSGCRTPRVRNTAPINYSLA